MSTTGRPSRSTLALMGETGRSAAALGQRIAARREELGRELGRDYTQGNLADDVTRILGRPSHKAIRSDQVSAWERGNHVPRKETLLAIATALKTTPDALRGGLTAATEAELEQLDRIERHLVRIEGLVVEIASSHGIRVDEPISSPDRPGQAPGGAPGAAGLPTDPPDAPRTVDTPQRAEGAQP
jgi:transcriptional regulator with XRE-family HTH domain